MADQIKALFIGNNPEQIEEVRGCFGALEVRQVSTADELFEVLESQTRAEFDFVLTIAGLPGVPSTELAQLLRAGFPQQPLYLVTFDMRSFDRAGMKKNGYNDAFLFPADRDYLIKNVARTMSAAADEAFSAVRLVDIEPDTELEFEVAVFLPLNNKYVSLIRQGDRLVRERLERLKSHQHSTIFVPVNQMQAFYDYSARRLLELEDGARSSTESNEKLQSSIRDFVTGIVSSSYKRGLGQGKETTENIRKIVEKYVALKNGVSLREQIGSEIGQTGDAYSHAGRVSTFAALFAMALHVSNVADVAVAGILHDLGIMLLPAGLQNKPEARMSKDELEQFKTHPLLSLRVVQDRRLPLNDDIVSAITQHHERHGGGGYPRNLIDQRVHIVAQIVALADRFDYLTRVEASLSPLDPEQAINRMSAEGIAHPDLQNELRRMFKMRMRPAKPAA